LTSFDEFAVMMHNRLHDRTSDFAQNLIGRCVFVCLCASVRVCVVGAVCGWSGVVGGGASVWWSGVCKDLNTNLLFELIFAPLNHT
jgi:hypothetical protein